MIDKVNLEQAVSEINENASKNFKEALDVAVNLGIDPKKTDQAVRGATNLPVSYTHLTLPTICSV